MQLRGTLSRCLVFGLALVAASCGGDSSDLAETRYSGIIYIPDNGCDGCAAGGRAVTLSLLCEGAPPQEVKTVETSDLGTYQLVLEGSDMDVGCPDGASLGELQGADRAVIIVAGVRAEDPATGQAGVGIGGVLSSRVGAGTSKDFNGPTQVACVASAVLTSGGEAPSALDDARILNLELAGAAAENILDYGTDVGGAADAVIACTDGGRTAVGESELRCVCDQLNAGFDAASGRCV